MSLPKSCVHPFDGSDDEDMDMVDAQNLVYALQALNLILPSAVTFRETHKQDEAKELSNRQLSSDEVNDQKLSNALKSTVNGEDRLRGYETLQGLRDKVSSYRQDYLNWRKFKPKGARGEAKDVFAGQAIPIVTNFEKTLVEKTQLSGGLERRGSLSHEVNAHKSPLVASLSGGLQQHLSGGLQHHLSETKEIVEAAVAKTVDQAEAWLRFYYNPFTPAESAPAVKVSTDTLSILAKRGVAVPQYSRDPSTVTHWILHIGVGQFHRSHQQYFLNELLNQQQKDVDDNIKEKWGYCGIGLMPFDQKMASALRNQDLLYTVMARTNTTCSVTIIGSMFDYIFAYDEFDAVHAKLCRPDIHIISLTITEKGYFQTVNHDLDVENPLIQNDLSILKSGKQLTSCPRTAVGFIYWGIRERYHRNLQPFTVMSCDNVPANGHVAQHMVISFSRLIDESFTIWIEQNIKFPSTMVDRITPATVAEHREILARDFGLVDEWPVVTEEFKQWAMEDNFTSRPKWELVGAILVEDVKPLELMKLRLLNGGHCLVGYLSYLAKYVFVDDAVNDVRISHLLRAYMDEMTTTIRNVQIELERYKEKIVERFGNKMIKDRLLRLCEDGSTKFFNTMKEALIELLDESKHIHMTALGIAGFIVFLSTAPEEEILDASKYLLIDLAKEATKDLGETKVIQQFLYEVFGPPLSCNLCFVHHVTLSVLALKTCSIETVLDCGGTLEALLQDHLRSPVMFRQLLQNFGT